MPTWTVYILRCGDGSLYTGITTDIERRLRAHAAGKGGAYTRSHLPVTLVWRKASRSGTAARKREAKIKTWNKQEKEAFLLTAASSKTR
jgi:predicted GIY-YIG superfamily endonuclease